MKEKIKRWWTKYIVTKYVIRRAVNVQWLIYKEGKRKVKITHGIYEVLCNGLWVKQTCCQEKGLKPECIRGFIAFRKLKELRSRFNGQYKIDLVAENDLPVKISYTNSMQM